MYSSFSRYFLSLRRLTFLRAGRIVPTLNALGALEADFSLVALMCSLAGDPALRALTDSINLSAVSFQTVSSCNMRTALRLPLGRLCGWPNFKIIRPWRLLQVAMQEPQHVVF